MTEYRQRYQQNRPASGIGLCGRENKSWEDLRRSLRAWGNHETMHADEFILVESTRLSALRNQAVDAACGQWAAHRRCRLHPRWVLAKSLTCHHCRTSRGRSDQRQDFISRPIKDWACSESFVAVSYWARTPGYLTAL